MVTSDLDLRFDALRARDELNAALLDDFKTFLLGAPDEALFRMSPIRYAAERGIPEQDAIDLFLYATHVGVLEFAWGVLCPGCMAFLTTPGSLRALEKRKRCNFCKLDIEPSIDDRVEVGFTVAPSVRRIRFHSPEALDFREDVLRLYFSSSLSAESAPHRTLQKSILKVDRAPPGVVHEARVALGEEKTVLLAPASHVAVFLHPRPGGPAAVSFDLLDGNAIPDVLEVGTGTVELRMLNRTSRTVDYIIAPSGTEWPTMFPRDALFSYPFAPYLTGVRLVSSQAFRDLFRAESIPSEGGLELKSVTVLFTDLTGSTALYERVGDLRAYDLVRKHFAVLREIVATQGGAIVKTIGDAVMANFSDAQDAMRAAVLMDIEIGKLWQDDMPLKIGLHSGPCVAVELNERLDYFGRTVNIAARVQGVASAGEIVCTEPVYEIPGVRDSIASAGFCAQRGTVLLKGIAGEVGVVRIRREAQSQAAHRHDGPDQ